MTDDAEVWRRILLPQTATIMEAVRNLNEVGAKIVLCVDGDGRLAGSISDGDVRRGLLRGLSMDDPSSEIVHTKPLVVPEHTEPDLVRALMAANKIQQIPVVDAEGRPVGLHCWDQIGAPVHRDNPMVIMAGGKGKRLRPYTEDCPKPMLLVAGKPMLQHIIERAQSQGFSRFVLSLNYLGDIIENHFGDGSALGVRLEYMYEQTPLGTAGALSLLEPPPEQPFVVTNGDVLTDIDYSELVEFLKRHDAAAVMAVRLHEWANPFGVVQMEGMEIRGIEEKPVTRIYINAGVYAFAPGVLDQLETNRHCDMPALFESLRKAGRKTLAYPMHEPWLDVGRPDDLWRANLEYDDDQEPNA